MQFILTCIAWAALMGWLFVLIAMQTCRWEPLAFAASLLAISYVIGSFKSRLARS